MNILLYKVMIISLLISVAISFFFIAYMRRLQFGQQIRFDGPACHLKKAGTPTMGGLIFIFSLAVTTILFTPKTLYLMLALLLTFGNAMIGFIDDYMKVAFCRSLGLKARTKILGQIVIVLIFFFISQLAGHSTEINVPFFNYTFDLGYFYLLLIFLMVIGSVNAVNLTDGIDGLAGGAVILALLAYLIIATIKGIPEIAFFSASLIGACFGFLIFNLHPAKVFMGDVGSLSLGGALAAVAILTKAELALVVIGGLFVIETLSVIIQVIIFRITGRRVFLMAPLHHHFELKGWSEWQVVISFWGVAFIFAIIGLLDLGFFRSI